MQEVEAVKTKEDILIVERLLRKHYGDLYGDLWRFGVNVALRISDLLSLTYDQMDMGRKEFTLVESKTGKRRSIRLNGPAMEVLQRRRADHPDHVFLFQVSSNRTRSMPPKPISRVTVARAFQAVGQMPSVDVKLGTHSMRKSRGWAMHSAGVPIEMIAKVLNHTWTSETMRYLGITQAEVMETYDTFEL